MAPSSQPARPCHWRSRLVVITFALLSFTRPPRTARSRPETTASKRSHGEPRAPVPSVARHWFARHSATIALRRHNRQRQWSPLGQVQRRVGREASPVGTRHYGTTRGVGGRPPDARHIRLDGGERLPFTTAVLATG